MTKELLLCIDDMIDSEGVIDNGSMDWLELVNRGGLTFINSLTLELFLAMELELRSHFQVLQRQGDFIAQATSAIKSNDDVLFFWSMLSAEWDETSATNLFDRIIHLWITIRGFSYASAWMEKYKNAKKVSTQKSKGLRKQL